MNDLLPILNTYRWLIHLMLHLVVPLLVSRFSSESKKAFIVMIATMLVDLDHLVADPIYAPNRCSIGFHPLHTIWIQPVYVILSFIPKTRWIGIGLAIHMLLDLFDCWWMKSL
jgi:hypothetical protein